MSTSSEPARGDSGVFDKVYVDSDPVCLRDLVEGLGASFRERDPERGGTASEDNEPTWKQVLRRYVEKGIPPGACMRAALENDLIGFVGRADPETQANIKEIVSYIHNEIPRSIRVSADNIDDHISHFYALSPSRA